MFFQEINPKTGQICAAGIYEKNLFREVFLDLFA